MTHQSGAPAGTFACVVDTHPRFQLDALRWYAALTSIAGVSPNDLVVHAVGSTSSEVLDYLKSQGVKVDCVDPFDQRSPHCNKISGAMRMAEETIDGLAVLCDTDIVVLEDPRRIDIPPDTIAGKVVDAPVPSLEVLLNIFAASGLTTPPIVPLPWGPGQSTVSGNNNGGLYLVPGPLLPGVATAWAHWAGWLLDRSELLEEWTVYVDQVAMALALSAQGVASTPLDVRWNTPTHDPTRIPADPPEPAVIHYHQQVDRRGLIRTTGAASIDGRIDVVNGSIRQMMALATPCATYGEWLSQSESEDVVRRRRAANPGRPRQRTRAHDGTRDRRPERSRARSHDWAVHQLGRIGRCATHPRRVRRPVRPRHLPRPAEPPDGWAAVPGSGGSSVAVDGSGPRRPR